MPDERETHKRFVAPIPCVERMNDVSRQLNRLPRRDSSRASNVDLVWDTTGHMSWRESPYNGVWGILANPLVLLQMRQLLLESWKSTDVKTSKPRPLGCAHSCITFGLFVYDSGPSGEMVQQ